MALKDTIIEDVKNAMKQREKEKLVALRSLQAAIKYLEIEKRPEPLTDDQILSVIKKTVKKHKDSIEQFEKAGRTDLVDKEKFELQVAQVYLPEEMTKEQLEPIVVQVISELNASSIKDMGAVMKAVINKTAGAADGKLVSSLVKEKLNS